MPVNTLSSVVKINLRKQTGRLSGAQSINEGGRLRLQRHLGVFLGLGLLLLCQACSYIEPTKTPPYYIRIDSIPFTDSLTNTVGRNQGKNTQQITDAWVFANGDFIGAYELPAVIPVPASGPNVTFTIEPGVFSDGIKDYRISYPFYKGLNKVITLSEGVVVPVSFRTTYKKANGNLKDPFPYLFDFESQVDSLQFTGTNNNTGTFGRSIQAGEVYPDGGAYSFKLAGRSASSSGVVEVTTVNQVRLPQDGSPIYLELNYKATANLLVGLNFFSSTQGTTGYIYDLNLLPTNGRWRKIYVSLVDEALTAPQKSNFKLSFRVTGAKAATDYVLLDNLRLMQMDR